MAPAMVREETRITILDSYDIVSSPLRELLHRRRGRSPEDEATRNEYLKPGEGRGLNLLLLLPVIDCHKPHSIASQFVHHVHHNSHYNAHSCPTYLGQLLQIANDEDVGATVLSNILTR